MSNSSSSKGPTSRLSSIDARDEAVQNRLEEEAVDDVEPLDAPGRSLKTSFAFKILLFSNLSSCSSNGSPKTT